MGRHRSNQSPLSSECHSCIPETQSPFGGGPSIHPFLSGAAEKLHWPNRHLGWEWFLIMSKKRDCAPRGMAEIHDYFHPEVLCGLWNGHLSQPRTAQPLTCNSLWRRMGSEPVCTQGPVPSSSPGDPLHCFSTSLVARQMSIIASENLILPLWIEQKRKAKHKDRRKRGLGVFLMKKMNGKEKMSLAFLPKPEVNSYKSNHTFNDLLCIRPGVTLWG